MTPNRCRRPLVGRAREPWQNLQRHDKTSYLKLASVECVHITLSAEQLNETRSKIIRFLELDSGQNWISSYPYCLEKLVLETSLSRQKDELNVQFRPLFTVQFKQPDNFTYFLFRRFLISHSIRTIKDSNQDITS